MHPNPFQGSVVITLPEGTGNSVELRVVDLVGRVVHAESGIDARKGSARTIQLENLSAGVYVLQVMLDERPRSIRIVKE
ncbi:MAG: T9SS type A sorting domain-containing protein [Flavobacteriales bacterium]|nr:T9SS type A sorting domain-containing protein [Flavobacteriales bacterium]